MSSLNCPNATAMIRGRTGHTLIVNGSNLRDVSVYKVGEGTPWLIDPPIGGALRRVRK